MIRSFVRENLDFYSGDSIPTAANYYPLSDKVVLGNKIGAHLLSDASTTMHIYLVSNHPHVERKDFTGGPRTVLRGTRIPVSVIFGYSEADNTLRSITERTEAVIKTLPFLTQAQIQDSILYYIEHTDEIEKERIENTEEFAKAKLKDALGEERYRRMTGE